MRANRGWIFGQCWSTPTETMTVQEGTPKGRVDGDTGELADTCYLHFLALNSSLVYNKLNTELTV